MDYENNNTENANNDAQNLPLDEIMPAFLSGEGGAGGDTSAESPAEVAQTGLNEGAAPENFSEADTASPGENATVPAATEQVPPTQDERERAFAAMVNELSDLRERERTLSQRNTELENMLSEQNKVAGETIEELAGTTPGAISIDLDDILYLPPEEQKARFNEYARSVADYTKQEVLKELAPVIGDYESARKSALVTSAYDEISGIPEFSDISEHREAIERILSKTPELDSLPVQKKLMLAYLADRGMGAISAPPAPARTAADIANEALSNPDVMRIIAQASFSDAKAQSDTIPPTKPSHGYGNAPVTIPKKPQSIDEVTNTLFAGLGK